MPHRGILSASFLIVWRQQPWRCLLPGSLRLHKIWLLSDPALFYKVRFLYSGGYLTLFLWLYILALFTPMLFFVRNWNIINSFQHWKQEIQWKNSERNDNGTKENLGTYSTLKSVGLISFTARFCLTRSIIPYRLIPFLGKGSRHIFYQANKLANLFAW